MHEIAEYNRIVEKGDQADAFAYGFLCGSKKNAEKVSSEMVKRNAVDKKSVLDLLYIAKGEFMKECEPESTLDSAKEKCYKKSWMVIDNIIRDVVKMTEI